MMTRNYKMGRLQAAVFSVAAAAGIAEAGLSKAPKAPVVTEEPVVEDSEFFLCTVLDDYTEIKFDNSFINAIDFVGRVQPQYAWVDADQGTYDTYETRRFRLGLEIDFADKGELFYQFNVGTDWGRNDADNFYDSVDSYGIEWEFSDAAKLTVGKHKPKITQEYGTSSKKILTVERSAIVNHVVPDKALGVSLSGDITGTPLFYDVGVFSGDEGDQYEHGGFGAGYGVNLSLGAKVADTKIRFDYWYQDGDKDNALFEDFSHIFSLNSASKWGDFGLRTDLIYAVGDEKPDAYGLVLLPFYNVTENFQIVGRYQYFGGDGADSSRLYSRYQRQVASDKGRGEDLHTIYLGANYYICGHALKLMTGVEYATQDGSGDGGEFDGFQYLIGLRAYW